MSFGSVEELRRCQAPIELRGASAAHAKRVTGSVSRLLEFVQQVLYCLRSDGHAKTMNTMRVRLRFDSLLGLREGRKSFLPKRRSPAQPAALVQTPNSYIQAAAQGRWQLAWNTE